MPTGAIPSSKMVLPIMEKSRRHSSSGAHPAFYIASWIFFSNLTILFNKWLIDNAGFREFLPRTISLLLLDSNLTLTLIHPQRTVSTLTTSPSRRPQISHR